MQFYQAMETINGKSDTIGTYEVYFGNYQQLFDAPKHYQKVTVDDVKRVAQTYLKKSNRSVAVLDAKEDKDL
jgi:zinc protease